MKAVDINTRRWSAVSGSDEYNTIVAEGLKWTRDNLPYINLVEHVKYPMIVKPSWVTCHLPEPRPTPSAPTSASSRCTSNRKAHSIELP